MDTVRRLPEGGWDPRVLVATCGTLVQTFMVVTRRYLVVIDTMIHPASGRALLHLAQEQQGQRQLLVVNTHADWDHYWGNQVFPGPIIGSSGCHERVLQDGPVELALQLDRESERFCEVVLTGPTLTFTDRLTIDGGDLSLQLIPTPGHQRDHLAVWIPEIRTLLAGDAAEEPFPLVDDAGNMHTLRASLALMRDLAPAWTLACHAPARPGGELLEANLAHFDRLEKLCRQARGPRPESDQELPEWVGYPIDEGWDALYREGHLAALKAMLKQLGYSAVH